MTASRRVVAIAALVFYAAAAVSLVLFLVHDVLALLLAIAGVLIAVLAAWWALLRTGAARIFGTVVAVLAVIGVMVVLWVAETWIELVVVVAVVAIGAWLTRRALVADPAARGDHPAPGEPVAAPAKPTLLMNPRSGGGKVEKFDLPNEAQRRGIEGIVLQPGDDLEVLARDAVARGADALGMAGGDGSQALVASIAAEHDLPFICIPAGTRNHFALDLGVDRDDVVGALEAFVNGRERRIDLATVNGRVFVNNVSLGVYAEIVQSPEYRDDKVGTAARMIPELLGPDTQPFDLRFDGPEGEANQSADLVLVSNNVYDLRRIGAIGTRERLDEGVLGIVAIDVRDAAGVAELVALETAGRVSRFKGWKAWTAETFTIQSLEPIKAGVDGEALVFDAPLECRIKVGALRVRIAPQHSGLSPAAVAPRSLGDAVRRLFRIAAGH